jgi:hypothetical protein
MAAGKTEKKPEIAPITSENARSFGSFAPHRKTTLTEISTFTVPPATPYETPEGLKAEDEETRIAFDSQGGVYPIRESVFAETYALAPEDRDVQLDTGTDELIAVREENDQLLGRIAELESLLSAQAADDAEDVTAIEYTGQHSALALELARELVARGFLPKSWLEDRGIEVGS